MSRESMFRFRDQEIVFTQPRPKAAISANSRLSGKVERPNRVRPVYPLCAKTGPPDGHATAASIPGEKGPPPGP